MSLPPATKDISNHPAAGSVAEPVNRQEKDKDVDRKLRLYGMIEALRHGRLPTNKQIDQTLQYVLDNSPVTTEKLSPDGKKLVRDVQEIINTLRKMVHEKNRDELLQQFLWHTRDVQMDKEQLGQIKEGVAAGKPGDTETESQQAVRHLRTLLSIVLTNSEVRKLLSDASLIGRDLLSTGMQKASSHIAPSKDALAGVDQSGPQDQFVSEGGRKVGPGETPILEGRVPGTGVSVKANPKEDEARIRGEDGQERDVGEVRDTFREQRDRAAESATGAAMDQERGASNADPVRSGIDNTDTSRLESTAKGIVGDERVDRAREAGEGARGATSGDRDTEHVDEGDLEGEPKKQGFMDRMRGVRDNFSDRVPTEQRERIERGKKFLAEDYFPPERRDQFIYRGKKVIIECQKHDDYQESIRWLLAYVSNYAQQGHQTVKDQGGNIKAVGEESLKRSISEIRTLLERFANGQSMEPILDAFRALSDDARQDSELRDWFQDVNRYVHKVLLEPGYVLEPECNDHALRLRESGRKFYDVKYKSHFDHLFGNTGSWFRAMGEDPTNKQFGEDWARLTHDLLFDSEGGLKFKTELWNDIRHVILPQIIDKVGYIPIPRIEYTDDALDLVVENLTLSGRNLFPNIIALEAHNFLRFSPYAAIADESKHRFTLTFGQMQADMRDVAFYYRKKTGMPKMRDSGLADVVLGGEGLTATVVLVSAGKDRSSVFKVDSVHVKVDSLKFSIRDSKHDLLYKTLRPLATGLVKRQIQKAMADAITTGLEYVDGQLVGVRDRMESAKADGQGRTQAIKDIFKLKKEEGAGSIKSSATSGSQSQFKVVADKRQSILSTEGHPAGWVNRTQEKAELATSGDDWRSDAFTIVR
ncbi:hypothetical protein DXG01_002797 [Tephrocybe rancida]|nr:hypothetical protein DXG01_002797 [Tephrocybe rancida]